jgi:hypothetical protein
MTRTRMFAFAAAAVALGGCANPREEAREALRGLRVAMEQHATRYGRYPDTVDAGLPASATNLPNQPRSGVRVELVHAGADGFQALARRRPWVCTMNVDARHAESLECVPLTNAPPAPPSGSRTNPMDSMLHSRDTISD